MSSPVYPSPQTGAVTPITVVIRELIQNRPLQRLSFAEYMDLVLYHPQFGYYSTGTVTIGGKDGDFLTSPSLGADFGELLAEQFVEMWQILGKPTPFSLVEMGAGTGTLAVAILSYLENHYPHFFEVLEYGIIEIAPGLIKIQKQSLQKYLEQGVKLWWKSWSDLDSNSLNGCYFSNELVDAFPVHQVIVKNQELQEIYVTVAETGFRSVMAPLSTPKLKEYFELVGVNLLNGEYPDGYQTEVNLAAFDWLKEVTRTLARGYVLTIDYGYSAQRYYHPQRHQGTLLCYYQHRYHANPYVNLGHQDLTTHVDFTSLKKGGEQLGLNYVGFTQQGLFLMALGLGDRLNELSSGKYNFQQILQRRALLHQLIEPTGLGGFGVLLQGKNLTPGETKTILKGFQEQPGLGYSDSLFNF